MPIPQLLLVNTILGLASAWVGRSEARPSSASAAGTIAFSVLLVGQALLMVPLGLYLYLFYPDWSWMYVLPARAVPSPLVVLVMLAYPGAAAAGYFAGIAICRAGRDRAVLAAGVVLALATGLSTALLWGRVEKVGTFNQFQGLTGLRPLHASGLGVFLLLALPAVLGAWGWAIRRVHRAQKKTPGQD